MNNYDDVAVAVSFLEKEFGEAPKVGLVLGSGLGSYADHLGESKALATTEIPNWPASTAPGHKGRLVVGYSGGKRVVVLQGRVHYYEQANMDVTTFPVRALAQWGVKTLILTNASGGITLDLRPGELVILKDHINFMGMNPLLGPNEGRWGDRFPDMTTLYDRELNSLICNEAGKLGLDHREGVYIAFSGPSYETPAEIRMARGFGADVVGMSSVPEAIVARHMGLKVACISCVANAAAGVTGKELSEGEVLDRMNETGRHLAQLLTHVLEKL